MRVDLNVQCAWLKANWNGAEAASIQHSSVDALVLVEDGNLPEEEWCTTVAKELNRPVFVGALLKTEVGSWLAIPPHAQASVPDSGRESGQSRTPVESAEALAKAGWAMVVVNPFGAEGPGERVYQMKGVHGVLLTREGMDSFAYDMTLEAALSLGLGLWGGGALAQRGTPKLLSAFGGRMTTQKDLHRAIVQQQGFFVEEGTPEAREGLDAPSDEFNPDGKKRSRKRRKKPRTDEAGTL